MQRHSDRKAPVYTSRIPASQFNDAEAKAYTESCVRSLVQSKAYKSYLRHIDYKDYFIFLWLLSGFFIVAVLYFHILVFVGDHQNIFSLSGVEESGIVDSSAQKGIRIAALLVALYVLPCVVIKSFVNVFWEQDDRGRKTYTFFFFLSLAIVSYGGEELHHPPFLTTLPSLRWQEWLMEGRHVSLSQMLLHAVVRALPLQGYFLAGYAVSIWYTSHWKKMWHLPLPLLSVPLLVGAVGDRLLARRHPSPPPVLHGGEWADRSRPADVGAATDGPFGSGTTPEVGGRIRAARLEGRCGTYSLPTRDVPPSGPLRRRLRALTPTVYCVRDGAGD
ncbi:hypothetical protein ADEAN_000079700 [Angomonas deanei]|uniref:Uncharacterized protein n=1 Tax=Angomonas deanei TaxID=59799 RepID=A0A7G2C149_9TRYP|nr:hypothetical protein ADEAN_000079700 [Angomonas deanei]